MWAKLEDLGFRVFAPGNQMSDVRSSPMEIVAGGVTLSYNGV